MKRLIKRIINRKATVNTNTKVENCVMKHGKKKYTLPPLYTLTKCLLYQKGNVTTDISCLLIVDLKPFRSYVKGKNSMGK